MSEEIRGKVAEQIDYWAHEWVVPITGVPSTTYETGAIKQHKAQLWQFWESVQPLIDQAKEEGKAECAKTHFKPDWEIKAKDVKAAMEEGYEAGLKEGRAQVIVTLRPALKTLADKLEEWFPKP